VRPRDKPFDNRQKAFCMKEKSPERQLADFLAKFSPEVRGSAKTALGIMRARLPGAIQMVYDNYNALVIAFGPTERASDAILSIVLYPRWVSLFFLKGAALKDPEKLLKGSGSVVRHIVLEPTTVLNHPGVRALIDQALAASAKRIDGTGPGRMVIKSVSAKQRARRPA
jgi:hypothetical protein